MWFLGLQSCRRQTDRRGGGDLVGGVDHPRGEVRRRLGRGREAVDPLSLHSRTGARLPGFVVATVQLLNELVHD